MGRKKQLTQINAVRFLGLYEIRRRPVRQETGVGDAGDSKRR